jgi:transketolase
MAVWRPCDAVESAVAWKQAIERKDGPSSLIFTRQALPHQQRTAEQITDVTRGGYILHEPAAAPVAVIIATGSEVGMAMDAAQSLAGQGTPVRVVSMPSTDHFDAQDQSYRDRVLPPSLKTRIAVEAGTTDLWRKYVGLDGDVMGIDTFGESGPAAEVYKYFGLTTDALVTRVQALVTAA